MSKYHYIVGIDPVGNQELGVIEFVQESVDGEQNIVYLYIQGDTDIPPVYYDSLPRCGHDPDEDCECMYGESLVQRVMKYYEDLGMSVTVIYMSSLISPLG